MLVSLIKNNSFCLKAMWTMLQVDEPEDFVIATNEVHSVREFVEASFKEINREIV